MLSLTPVSPSKQERDGLTVLLFSPSDFWEYYLPYLYSCISFLGVLLLLGECSWSGREWERSLGQSHQGGKKGNGGMVGGMMERRVWQVTAFCPHSVYSVRSCPHVLGYWEAAGQAPGMSCSLPFDPSR